MGKKVQGAVGLGADQCVIDNLGQSHVPYDIRIRPPGAADEITVFSSYLMGHNGRAVFCCLNYFRYIVEHCSRRSWHCNMYCRVHQIARRLTD